MIIISKINDFAFVPVNYIDMQYMHIRIYLSVPFSDFCRQYFTEHERKIEQAYQYSPSLKLHKMHGRKNIKYTKYIK